MTTTGDPIPTQRALVPSVPRWPTPAAFRPSRLPALAAWRGLPAVTRTAGAVAAGFIVEYAVRGVANRALERVLPAVRHSGPSITRTIVTEVVIIERRRRRS